ncbi:hypothetical protein ACFHYO_10590 [Paracoccus panacisoli]|uniref:Uncharacterized protein n=1 Tax=Paracoccus panacisoli TaxID=1510163 RepID=A0ABV6T5P1_9RHOB
MAARPATFTKLELTSYAQAMREAQIETWALTAVKPDGTTITLTAGAPAPRDNEIDKMLGLK